MANKLGASPGILTKKEFFMANAQPTYFEYRVKAGDSLSLIMAKF